MSFEGYNGYEVLPDGMPADVARDLAQREMYEQQMEMQFWAEMQQSQIDFEEGLRQDRMDYLNNEINEMQQNLELIDSPSLHSSMSASLKDYERELSELQNGGYTSGYSDFSAYMPADPYSASLYEPVPYDMPYSVTETDAVETVDTQDFSDASQSNASSESVTMDSLNLEDTYAFADSSDVMPETGDEETEGGTDSYLEDFDGMNSDLFDTDGDGVEDLLIVTNEGDGFTEIFATQDADGDGNFGDKNLYMETSDSDGDGIEDTLLTMTDEDGDGEFESITQDTYDAEGNLINHEDLSDGELPSDHEDDNDNGELPSDHEDNTDDNDVPGENKEENDDEEFGNDLESYEKAFEGFDQETVDTDGDGYAETFVVSDEGEAYAEIFATSDLDGDGQFGDQSIYQTQLDTDGDGFYDSVTTDVDLDGDGAFDMRFNEEYDAEGNLIDSSYEILENTEVPNTNDTNNTNDYPVNPEGNGTYYYELEQFDPATADPEAVTGSPETAMEHWEFQGDTQRCTVYSQMFVIEELTGAELDIDELCEFAQENGWFSEANGASPSDMNKLLDTYDIENELTYNNSLDDLEQALANGDKVIVCVDSDEYAMGENDDVYIPQDGPNHAVEVIGIDRTDPENPMVILNDSGVPNGAGEMVPMATFEDAWEDSSHLMITAR